MPRSSTHAPTSFSVEVSDHPAPSDASIAVIVPVRITPERPDALDRLALLFESHPAALARHAFCVVDDGSPMTDSQTLRAMCRRSGAGYVRLDTEKEMFSIGRARDAGAVSARARFLFFQDVDLLPYATFYDDLEREIVAQGLIEDAATVVVIPCMYLTEKGSEEYLETAPEHRRSVFLQRHLEGRSDIVQMFAPCASTIVMDRLHFLSLGGHDPAFRGHGFEDFELLHRAFARCPRFPRPRDYYRHDRTWNIHSYVGFRSMYRLYGDFSAGKGLFTVHLFHPMVSSPYATQNATNRALLEQRMRAVDALRESIPSALPAPECGRTLALGARSHAFYRSIEEALPQFGQITFHTENEIGSPDELAARLRSGEVDRVLMPNPYGNERRLELYRKLRTENLPCIVSDRGALPDSLFFDVGFNADSPSYDVSRWDVPLDGARRARVRAYIAGQRGSDEALEQQGPRRFTTELRRELGLGDRRVLLVPFQRPKDTVCRYFAGAAGSYDSFVAMVDAVAQHLPSDWVIVAKKHPLEVERPPIRSVRFASDDTHIKDLIELCDAVLLLNSGVGLMALLWDRPVLHAGDVFYTDPRLSRPVRNEEEVLDALREGFAPDRETTERFISYLIEDLYSFGTTRYEIMNDPDGSLRSVSRETRFHRIVIPGQPSRRYAVRNGPDVDRDAPIFARYANDSPPSLLRSASLKAAGAVVRVVAGPAKSQKLLRNPAAFFADSRFRALRWFARRQRRKPG